MNTLYPQNWKTSPTTQPLVAITAYDTCFASIAAEAGVDMILVGDSAANVVLGLKSTRDISAYTLRQFVAAVRQGAPHTHVIADLPFESVQTIDRALEDAKKFMEAGADAVKLEGYHSLLLSAFLEHHIPVMGHLGLLPQTAKSFKKIGSQPNEIQELLETVQQLKKTHIYSLVLENVQNELAQRITQEIGLPTIGIGAGPHTTGQILVLHDVLGLYAHKLPPFAKKFANLRDEAIRGIQEYKNQVQNKVFPTQ